ncbi:DUF1176 domain-containing protein [Stenotrophomonas geniculata]|jgi:hypothetical protein|uniref:DUF1176 domain-containing protein n=2 Tax=Stenotrophomonas geniculata TaxID=86188 RepID=A0A0L8A811_9GAMM|nr:DUF1176 domain-containing protein [Stenotrophomonas geniculata]MBN4972340.1 DUF1176 domain-containing protein [Stenotrophomonas maltophilia]KOE98361.1 hypothetical protein W7K_14855 [Stenotrophomonas geniculata N1]MCI1067953.1 DUF1176 domain-containing protein [Stenotrophomonas maltophilia]MCI1109073.1 DUF1176 domain-containing protein [Stenotrophomonas maltophilia]MCU1016917.1 DUF1176 domain-containing protein [Stenotrophomonas maltophilia]
MYRPLSALIVGLLLPLASHATNTPVTPGIEFVHHDWFLACDNTGTCRAAGYGPENADGLLGLMLERSGGPGTATKARLRVGEDGESAMPEGAMRLLVNDRDLGPVQDTGADEAVTLRPAQVEALLAALPGRARIEVIDNNGTRWPISDRGAAAVLLKMDEAQGRIGTPGALVRRGTRSEASVPAARARPVIVRATLAAARPGDRALGTSEALRDALIATIGDSDDCPHLVEYTGTPEMVIERLDGSHVLVQALCQMGAYNYSNGFWIARDQPPYAAEVVTLEAEGFSREDRTLYARYKGRGIGDCVSGSDWAWDGRRFQPSSAFSTGLCRGIPGGHWNLPTLVSEVR